MTVKLEFSLENDLSFSVNFCLTQIVRMCCNAYLIYISYLAKIRKQLILQETPRLMYEECAKSFKIKNLLGHNIMMYLPMLHRVV